MTFKTFLFSAILLGSSCTFAQVEGNNPQTGTQRPSTIDPNPERSKELRKNLVQVADNVYMIKGRGGNIGIMTGKEGVYMIDNQFAEATPTILETIKLVSQKPVKILVNTHHHGDHTGGNKNMRDAGAIIFAHQNAEKRMNASKYKKAREQYNAVLKEGIKKMKARIGDAEFMRDEKKNTLAVMKQIGSPTDYLEESVNMPTVTFTNNLNFTFNEAIKVYHLRNAHTDGDVIVHFPKSNVIHTGDVFFNGKYPYIDLENGGSVKGAMAALQRIISLSDSKTKIIPGHGEVANVAAVKKAMGLLRYLQDAIAFQKASGKTLEQIKAMKDITREYDNQGYGDGYVTTDRMIETVYHGDGKNLKVDVSDRRD